MAPKLVANRDAFNALTALLRPGAPVAVVSEDGDRMGGIVLGVEKRGKAKNPLALSTWHVNIAVADAARMISYPFSQIRTGNMSAGGRTIERADNFGGFPMIEAFENLQRESREKRVMLTRNILAAFSETGGKGQIVNFVGEDGSVRPGIMMRRAYDHGKETARRPVTFRTGAQVTAWLATGEKAFGEGVSMEIAGGKLVVTTVASKADGGKYFLDRGVRDAIGGDFIKKSTGMVATANPDRARAAADALVKRGAALQARSSLDEARKLVAEKGAKDSIPDDVFNPAQPERSMTQEQRGELEARQMQGKARRGGQEAVSDQEGGLFDAARDQGSLFSLADLPTVSIDSRDWGKLPKSGRGRLQVLRGRVRRWYRTIEGTSVRNAELGEVFFNIAGAKKTLRAGENLLAVAKAIPKVIERGKLLDSEPARDRGMKAVHRIGAMVRDQAGGEMAVVVVVRESAEGQWQYSLHRYVEESAPDAPADTGRADRKASAPALEGGAGDVLNLVPLAEDFKQAETAADSGLVDALLERLAALGLKDKTRLERANTLGGAAGRFTPGQQRLIEIALDTSQGAEFTLDHEAIHALRDMDLFKDSEWAILVARAKREPGLMRSIERRYRKLDAEAQAEEAVADLFAKFQRGDLEVRGMVAKSLKMLRDVLEAVGNALRGRGARTGEGVMGEVASGRVGDRTEQVAVGADAQITAKESRPELDEVLSLSGTDPTWKGRMGGAWGTFRKTMQDRYLPLIRAQETIERMTGRAIPESMNAYRGEELMSGRIGARLDTLHDDMVAPLFDAMAAEDIDIDALESYLYARHAPERNARIAEINPEMPDGGSGMSDLEARAVMKRISAAGQMEAMERLAERVDAMRDMALDYRVETGLMSQEDADAWRDTYEYYVPLRGFKETQGDAAAAERINRSGGGVNVSGKESKRAFGRRSEADSPLSYTILQAEEAIVRGETNRVAQKFVRLARENPDDDFWQVQKVSKRQRINEDSGLVESYVTNQLLAQDKDWTVTAKMDGKEVRVTMNRDNPKARSLADSMRRLTEHQLDLITRYLGVVNRFLSSVNTSYNPEFVISNAVRDLQTAAINIQGVDIPGLEGKMLRYYPGALKASTKGAWGKTDGEWGKWYKEFVNAGWRVYFNRVEDVGLIKKRIEKEFDLAAAKAGKKGSARLHVKRGFLAARDAIENTNLGVENAARLASYRAAREAGASEQQAASIAKNLTVNFNRRGTAGPALNAAYMFYNASMQGSVRMMSAIYHSKKVRKTMAGVMVFGLAVELLNAMSGGEDDDGEDFYDKIPDYEKQRNIILMIPGSDTGEYIKTPLPYGYNVFFGAGRAVGEISRRGGDRWQESAGSLIETAVDSFNPVGGTQSILNFFAPTILDPAVDLTLNRDFTDRPILPEQNPFGPPENDSQRYWPGTPAHWREISEFLNESTGGNQVEPGAIDVSPETLDYLADTVVGAAGAFVDRAASLPNKALEGELNPNDIPFARKVTGSKSPWVDKSLYYDRSAQVELHVKRAKDYLELEDMAGARSYVDRHEKILTMEGSTTTEGSMKWADKQMKIIRKAKRANEALKERGLIDETAYNAERDVAREAENRVVLAFNRAWNQVVLSDKDGRDGER